MWRAQARRKLRLRSSLHGWDGSPLAVFYGAEEGAWNVLSSSRCAARIGCFADGLSGELQLLPGNSAAAAQGERARD